MFRKFRRQNRHFITHKCFVLSRFLQEGFTLYTGHWEVIAKGHVEVMYAYLTGKHAKTRNVHVYRCLILNKKAATSHEGNCDNKSWNQRLALR